MVVSGVALMVGALAYPARRPSARAMESKNFPLVPAAA